MGYVKFWTVSDVNRALESEAPVFRDEDGKEHPIRMKRAETKNTVYISGFPRHLAPQKVEEEIERIGKVIMLPNYHLLRSQFSLTFFDLLSQ